MDKVALEILEKINNFYSAAFSQLLTVTLGIVAFVGVFIPILATYYQSRNLRIEKQNLEDHINNRINQIKAELNYDLNQELQKKLKEFEKCQEAKTDRILAGVLHVQANFQLSKEEFKLATDSIISAIENCLSAGDELNLSRGLNTLIVRCLPKISHDEEPDLESLATKINGLNESIKKINSSGRYSDTLNSLNKAHKKTIARLAETAK